MFEFNANFCSEIARLSIEKFNSLPKTGKPNLNEWTVLSCIAKHDSNKNSLEIVALGTGSKCIGASKMSPKGDILNDSHAEIICRRAFLRYLYYHITRALIKDNSIFITSDKKFVLHENITFHFFTNHVPCGDAAIFPKHCDDIGNCVYNSCKRLSREVNETNKKMKIDSFRTGAKCITNTKEDSKFNGSKYHTLGAVRTKPGRGDPTLSLSCSDKIAKWTFVGIQGALLTHFILEPIYLSSFTIIKNVPFSEQALVRSLQTRFNINCYKQNIPLIGQADISCTLCKNDSKRPCPSSIIWSDVETKPLEISVNGKKQGVTKKNRNTKEGRLLISKQELFSTFMSVIKMSNTFNELLNLSYVEVKRKTEYYNVWNEIKSKVFNAWTVKNQELLNFVND